MTRPLVFGNGNLLVCFDKYLQVRDFYYPYVGLENHVNGDKHRFGIFADGRMSWSTEWDISMKYKKDTLVSDVKANVHQLGIEIDMNQAVLCEDDVFLTKAVVKNLEDREREIKLFFHQDFNIYGVEVGNTVYYSPHNYSLVHYQGRRYFLINGMSDGVGFNDFATGKAGYGLAGTFTDAEDGVLGKNPIEHGSTDSTMGFTLKIPAKSEKTVYYWIAVGKKFHEVDELNKKVVVGPEKLLKRCETYWKKWLGKKKLNFNGLKPCIKEIFNRSLLTIRTNTDKRGAIIAANDSDILYFNRDTYSYMWPRDGALIARSLDRCGYGSLTENFFRKCNEIVTDEGYLFPKYRADGSVGSSWHSWIKHGKVRLPVQEDETALVLDALWKHYEKHKNPKFLEEVFNFIDLSSGFLLSYIDKETGLPNESYNLWEEKFGVHTFTACTVYAGLKAAQYFAEEFKDRKALKYKKAAENLKKAILERLYDKETGLFFKRIHRKNSSFYIEKTVDASTFYGLFEYGVLDVNDKRVSAMCEAVKEKLMTPVGGLLRYEGDIYQKITDKSNPWFVTTLWLAEYYIKKAKCKADLKPAAEILEWVCSKALSTGILAEQMNPYDGSPLSVAPLTWSHAGFVIAVDKYIEKRDCLIG